MSSFLSSFLCVYAEPNHVHHELGRHPVEQAGSPLPQSSSGRVLFCSLDDVRGHPCHGAQESCSSAPSLFFFFFFLVSSCFLFLVLLLDFPACSPQPCKLVACLCSLSPREVGSSSGREVGRWERRRRREEKRREEKKKEEKKRKREKEEGEKKRKRRRDEEEKERKKEKRREEKKTEPY